MTRGRHQFGFGVFLAQSRTTQATNTQSAGIFTFSGSATGLGLADFLTGKLTTYEQGLGSHTFNRVNYIGLYGQDSWQLKPRLTVSAGLRWAPILPIMDYRRPVPTVFNFDINRYVQGLRSTVFLNAPPGFIYPGDPGLVQHNNGANAAKPKADLFNPQWALFSPRLGFAWDVEGNGRTSIRASYGLSYEDYAVSYMKGAISDQPPWAFRTLVLAPFNFEDPWRTVSGGDPFANFNFSKNMPWVPSATYMPTVPEITPTYTQSWNLSLQREIVADTLVSVTYLGTEVTHLQAGSPLNPPIYIPGNADANGNCFTNGKAVYFKTPAVTSCSTVAN